MTSTPSVPAIAYSANGAYLVVSPGVETAQFKLDNPQPLLAPTARAVVLDALNRAVVAPAAAPSGGPVVLAPVDSAGAPNANGATITPGPPNQTLNLNSASATQPGAVTALGQTFGGTKTFGDGVSFGNPGGPIPGPGFSIVDNFYARLLATTVTWNGPFAAPPSALVAAERNGNRVFVDAAAFGALGGGIAARITSAPGFTLDSWLRPPADRFQNVSVVSAGVAVPGVMVVRSSGVIEFGLATGQVVTSPFDPAVFPATALTNGIIPTQMQYVV